MLEFRRVSDTREHVEIINKASASTSPKIKQMQKGLLEPISFGCNETACGTATDTVAPSLSCSFLNIPAYPPEKKQAEASPNRTGMPDQLKTGIESLSEIDMSDVRVHANSGKPARFNALAYAQGNEIHLAPGQERHLPHEAWHIVQQKQGRVRPTMKMKGEDVNDDARLEKEADRMGERILQQKTHSGHPLRLHFSHSSLTGPLHFGAIQRELDVEKTFNELIEYFGGIVKGDPSLFYEKVKPYVNIARDSTNPDHEKAKILLTRIAEHLNKTPKIRDSLVRVNPTQSVGAVRPSGLDELFKTEETGEWLKRSSGLVPGITAQSLYRGSLFDWLDAQGFIRVKTEAVLWTVPETDELAGHTGALKGSKGFHVEYMEPFHEARNEVAKGSKTPREAVINVLRYHLVNTLNETGWDKAVLKGGKVVSSEKYALIDRSGLYEVEVSKAILNHREMLKQALADFESNSAEITPYVPTLYSPPSPLTGEATGIAPMAVIDFNQFGSFLQQGPDWTAAAAVKKPKKS